MCDYEPLAISIVTNGSKVCGFFRFLVMRKTPRKQKADLSKQQDVKKKFVYLYAFSEIKIMFP